MIRAVVLLLLFLAHDRIGHRKLLSQLGSQLPLRWQSPYHCWKPVRDRAVRAVGEDIAGWVDACGAVGDSACFDCGGVAVINCVSIATIGCERDRAISASNESSN